MPDPTPYQLEADRRVHSALARIESAQRELERASQDLSSLIGGLPAWERVGKLCDRVHAEWHRVRKLVGGVDLDEAGRRAVDAPRGP